MAEVRKAVPKKPTTGKIIPKKSKASKSVALAKVPPMQVISSAPDAPAAALDKSFVKEAEKLDARIVATIDRMGKDVIFLGEAFNEMQDKSFHVALGFPRMEDYIKSRWPDQNKTTIFQAMRITRELTSGVNPPVSREDVREMTKENAEGLAKLKKAGNDITPELIQAAKDLPTKQFEAEVILPRTPDLAQRQAAARGATLATEPEVLVKRTYTLSSPTEAMRVKSFEIFRWLRKEHAADEQPEVTDLAFEDEALRFIFAGFLAEHQTEFEQVMAEREAHTEANARAFSDAGAVTTAGGDTDGVAEADEDAEEAAEAVDSNSAQAAKSTTIPICTGKKADETRCGSPCIAGKRFCFYHTKQAEKQGLPTDAL